MTDTYATDAQEDTIHVKRASYEALKARNAALEAGLDDWLRVLNSLAGLKVPIVIYERLMTMLEQAQELKEGRDG